MLSGVSEFDRAIAGYSWFGVVVGRLKSECPQQDRADKNEHGAYC